MDCTCTGTNSHLFSVQLEEEVETFSHMEEDPEPGEHLLLRCI